MHQGTSFRILILCGATGLLSACNSSGGINFQNLALLGSHHVVSYSNDYQALPQVDSSRTGTSEADGILGIAWTTTDNDSGTVTGPIAEDWTYNLLQDWTFNSTDPLGQVFQGGTFSGTDVSILGSTSSGSQPSLAVFLRKSGSGFSDSSLSGDYFLVAFACDPGVPAHRSSTGTVSFDGAGSFSGTVTTNTEGTIAAPVALSGTYSVAGDGGLALTVGAETLSGGMLNGAGVAVAASTSAGADPAIFILVKKGGTFTDASLSGKYFACTFSFDVDDDHHESETGTVTFDGAGSFSFSSLVSNEEGVISTGSGGGTYSVASDGVLSATAGSEVMQGGLRDGGSVAILANVSAGTDVQVAVLVKG